MEPLDRRVDEASKVVEGLERKIRQAGLTFADVEKAAGLERDSLLRALRAPAELRIEQVTAVLEVLGVPPVDFFVEVFGPPPSPLYAQNPEHHTFATTVRVMHRSLLRRMIWKLRERGTFSDTEAKDLLAELERELPVAERDVWGER
jgi:lambda repressor-like predicted transcriptional regulator